ncbi:DegV family protein [Ornithinimicrobium sp. F0845]|uniref:DegV family protein n=1 Tax=Ornithinimicrobium sp. F0845 TaxID=2926412 RepID=UPI001FF13886|nr:DegV family protein [Ornithinimicrobium sp. F0845]
MSTAVLTDSTACLPPELAEHAGVAVIPLHVQVGRSTLAEGVDITVAEVAELLRAGKEKVGTSRPAPGEFVVAFRDLVEATACDSIVAVLLSSAISGTVEAAQLAAAAVSEEVRVEVVDSRTLGMGMGYAAVSAARAAREGASLEDVADLARRRCEASSTYFYVDTLEHLRRGGRVGTAQAILGSALAIKPLLMLTDGEVQLAERVRTRAKALARLEERCREAIEAVAGDQGVDVAVHHLGWPDQAEELQSRLREVCDGRGRLDLVELGAVAGVHTGPGTLAVAVAPQA